MNTICHTFPYIWTNITMQTTFVMSKFCNFIPSSALGHAWCRRLCNRASRKICTTNKKTKFTKKWHASCKPWSRTSFSNHRCFIMKFMNHTFPCTLNSEDNKVQLTRAFTDVCQLHQLRRTCDVVWDVVPDGDDEAAPPPPAPPPSSACLPSLSWCFYPTLVVHYIPLHLCSILHWGLWCIWPLSLLSQTIWALLLIPQWFPTPQNVGGDQRGCV